MTPSVELFCLTATRALGAQRKGPNSSRFHRRQWTAAPPHTLLGCPMAERQAPSLQGRQVGREEAGASSLPLTFSSYSSRVSTVSQRKSCFRSTSSLKDCRRQMGGTGKDPNFSQAIPGCRALQHPKVLFCPYDSLVGILRKSYGPAVSQGVCLRSSACQAHHVSLLH